MPTKLEILTTAATTNNGACTFGFNQAQAFKVTGSSKWFSSDHKDGAWEDQGKMYKMVLRGQKGQKAEMGGVCATVGAFWVIFHATQGGNNPFAKDRSVWDYLYTKDGKLNMGSAANVVIEHQMSSANQRAYLDDLLRKFGIVTRTKSMSGVPIGHNFIPTTPGMMDAIVDDITKNYGYKLIEIKKAVNGSGGGHEFSAFCDGPDVTFMDSNIGEFWLPTKAAFNAWFRIYWSTMYASTYKSIRVVRSLIKSN